MKDIYRANYIQYNFLYSQYNCYDANPSLLIVEECVKRRIVNIYIDRENIGGCGLFQEVNHPPQDVGLVLP